MSKRKGFTLVEVMLFLAITAALFVGIAMGVQNSIFSQRYNDSTQNFFEFMKSIYSKVSNPQSAGKGNSDEAIYGKMIVFGEKTDINGTYLGDNTNAIFVYDVVGRADTVSGGLGTGTVTNLLVQLDASVIRVKAKDNNTDVVTDADLASPEKYLPRWGAVIDGTQNGTPFTGTILVVRHPRSGTINTLYSGTVLEINAEFEADKGTGNYNGVYNMLKDKLGSSFEIKELDFCVNPYGAGVSSDVRRQNVRLLPNARNASDVELISLDIPYDEKDNPEGNKCW